MTRSVRSSLLLLLLGLVACTRAPVLAPVGESPEQRLSRLERSLTKKSPASAHSALGASLYLVTGDKVQASPHLERALTIDPNDPVAWMLRAEWARESLDEEAAARALLRVLTGSPNSPAAEIAAIRLMEIAQSSPRIDALIEEALAPLETGAMGLKALTAARAREVLVAVRDGRNDDQAAGTLRRTLGTPQEWTVVGPLGAYRVADFDVKSPFDEAGHVLAPSYPTPVGDVKPRQIPAPDGVLSLDQDSWMGDVYEAFVDLEVKRPGAHLVSLRGAGMATVWVDGVKVLERRTWPERAPQRSWGALELPAGAHRMRVRFTRAEGSWLAISLPRIDGEAAEISMKAPKPGPASSLAPGVSAAPAGGGALAWVETALSVDPGNPLAAWARVVALSADAPEQAQDALEGLIAATGRESLPLRSLRIDLLVKDPDLPQATLTSLVQRDVDAILQAEPPQLRALLFRFEKAREDKRWETASESLRRAEQSAGPNPLLYMARARLALERGDKVEARLAAEKALESDPGRCDALKFRADMARADDEIEMSAILLPQQLQCPGGLAANASWLRGRGLVREAADLLERVVKRNPASFSARRVLSDVLVASGDTAAALAVLEPLVELWPRRTGALERIAELHELAGERSKARDARRKANAKSGANLALARAVALDSSAEVMDWAARDGIEAIENYRAAGVSSNAGAVYVLDSAAFEVQEDGSALERTHTIVQVLDKRGIDQWGEVQVPPDAQPLVVRTVKRNGRLLEAELIAAKDSISMPNLEPGDFVEVEWLRAHEARPAALPGWSSGVFFFRGADTPFHESSYEVRAPVSRGLEVQTEGLGVLQPELIEGDVLRVKHVAKNVSPYLREPWSPSDVEVLPWLEAGAGADELAFVSQLADWALLSMRPTGEVHRLVRDLALLPVRERIAAVVERVRSKVQGDSASNAFGAGAGQILAGERGNRLVALKAALSAVGVPSRVVLVKPFTTYPKGYRFPHGEVFTRAVLRIEPAPGEFIWMDFSNRFAPLGVLPDTLSGLEAVLLPEPGERPERIVMPTLAPTQDRTTVSLDLSFSETGDLVGTLTQQALGYEAAQLRRGLEQTNPAELKRAQESRLASVFPRVVLESLEVVDTGRLDEPLSLVSRIRVPSFGQRADGVVALPAHFGEAQLARRMLSRGERQTTFLIGASSFNEVHAKVRLPANGTVRVPQDVLLESRFGTYEAKFSLDSGVLTFDETRLLKRGRYAPDTYGELARFASGVDAAQARELVLEALE